MKLKGEGGSHNVDIILGGVVGYDHAWLQRGDGGQESGKTWPHNLNYLISYVICKLLSN